MSKAITSTNRWFHANVKNWSLKTALLTPQYDIARMPGAGNKVQKQFVDLKDWYIRQSLSNDSVALDGLLKQPVINFID